MIICPQCQTPNFEGNRGCKNCKYTFVQSKKIELHKPEPSPPVELAPNIAPEVRSNKKTFVIASLLGTTPAVLLFIVLIIGGFIYFTMGLFVVQPIGAIPEGTTVLYWRYDTNLPFISSADGISLERTGAVSLMSRMVVLGAVGNVVKDRKIMNLPYSESLYLYSTGGVRFEK